MLTLLNAPECGWNTAVRGVPSMFGMFAYLSRNAKAAIVVGVVVAAIGAATAIGWATAPVA